MPCHRHRQSAATAPGVCSSPGGTTSMVTAPTSRRAVAASRTAACVSGVGAWRPLSVNHAMRRAPTSTVEGSPTGAGGKYGHPRRPALAITGRSRAMSSTRRVIGPSCVRPWSSPRYDGVWPVRATRPLVGFRPTMPHTWAGWRMLSPVSLPMSKGEPPAATIAAAPPLLPPGDRERSYGLFDGPTMNFLVSSDQVNSGVLVLPRTRFALAAFRRATTVASRSGNVIRASRGSRRTCRGPPCRASP